MAPIQSIQTILHRKHTAKNISSFRVYFLVLQLDIRSSVSPAGLWVLTPQTWHCDDSTITFLGLRRIVLILYKTSTDQKFIIKQVLTLFVVQGVLVTTLQTPYGNFLLKYHKWPQAKLESKAEWCPVFGFEKHWWLHCRTKWKHVHVQAMYYIDICTKHVISCHITCVSPHLILNDGGGSVAEAVVFLTLTKFLHLNLTTA